MRDGPVGSAVENTEVQDLWDVKEEMFVDDVCKGLRGKEVILEGGGEREEEGEREGGMEGGREGERKGGREQR